MSAFRPLLAKCQILHGTRKEGSGAKHSPCLKRKRRRHQGAKKSARKIFPECRFSIFALHLTKEEVEREREGIFLQTLYGLLRCSFFLFSPKPTNHLSLRHIFTLFFSFSPTAYKSFCFTIAPSFSHIMEGEIIGGGNGGQPTLLLVFFSYCGIVAKTVKEPIIEVPFSSKRRWEKSSFFDWTHHARALKFHPK